MMLESQGPDEVLNSWKEIACYLNRGVRTVQRWETDLALPVRRPRGKRRSAVIAMRSEINKWLNDCPQAALEKAQPENFCGWKEERDHQELRVEVPIRGLLLQSRLLHNEVLRSCQEMETALQRLLDNIERMAQPEPRKFGARSTAA